jgi:hypothetical protein
LLKETSGGVSPLRIRQTKEVILSARGNGAAISHLYGVTPCRLPRIATVTRSFVTPRPGGYHRPLLGRARRAPRPVITSGPLQWNDRVPVDVRNATVSLSPRGSRSETSQEKQGRAPRQGSGGVIGHPSPRSPNRGRIEEVGRERPKDVPKQCLLSLAGVVLGRGNDAQVSPTLLAVGAKEVIPSARRSGGMV